jgi:hypothetical protein
MGRAFCSQVGEAALSLILGKNYKVNLEKRKKKLDLNLIFGENFMILLRKQSYNSPCYRRKNSPDGRWIGMLSGQIKLKTYSLLRCV